MSQDKFFATDTERARAGFLFTPIRVAAARNRDRALGRPPRARARLFALRRLSRSLFGVVAVFLLLLLAVQASRFGMARLFANRGASRHDERLCGEAVRLAPSDPEIYRTRAAVLFAQQRWYEAIADLEHAIALSPLSYKLWQELGTAAREQGDMTRALSAFTEAARLAPQSSESRWLLGTCKLKAGQLKEGFDDLRIATTNNSILFLKSAELAWAASGGNPGFVITATNPQTTKERFALTSFLFRLGKVQEANAVVSEIHQLSDADWLSLLAELIESKRFADAREIWLRRQTGAAQVQNNSQITDGGFESKMLIDDPGFGWQFQQHEKTVGGFFDMRDPHTDMQSLRLDWRGLSDPSTPLVGQLILVKPGSRYRLQFATRVEDLITGALPIVAVLEALGNVTESAQNGRVLASQVISSDVLSWQKYSVEFETGSSTQAVYVVIRREKCAYEQCPIYGSAWFDDFSLTSLS